jgi:hypothetical protein
MTLLLVMLIGLVRQVKRLVGSVGEFNRQVQPLLVDMQRQTEEARVRAEKLQAVGNPFQPSGRR